MCHLLVQWGTSSCFLSLLKPAAITRLVQYLHKPHQPFLCTCYQVVLEFRSPNTQHLIYAFKKNWKSYKHGWPTRWTNMGLIQCIMIMELFHFNFKNLMYSVCKIYTHSVLPSHCICMCIVYILHSDQLLTTWSA